MAPTSTGMTDNHGRTPHAIPAHMAHLATTAADDIPITTAKRMMTTATGIATQSTTKTTIAATTTTTSPVPKDVTLGTLPGHMPRNIAQVANGLVLAVPGEMPSLPAVFAGLFICAFCSNMTLLEAVVA